MQRQHAYAKLLERSRELNCGKLKKHIFLCVSTKPENACCNPEISIAAWEYLKKRIKELGLEATVGRSRADCLRLCQMGPIAVIYPEGVWYHSMTSENLEKVIQEHILSGRVVKELSFTPAN